MAWWHENTTGAAESQRSRYEALLCGVSRKRVGQRPGRIEAGPRAGEALTGVRDRAHPRDGEHLPALGQARARVAGGLVGEQHLLAERARAVAVRLDQAVAAAVGETDQAPLADRLADRLVHRPDRRPG